MLAIQVDAALDESNQALVATLIKVLFTCTVYYLPQECLTLQLLANHVTA